MGGKTPVVDCKRVITCSASQPSRRAGALGHQPPVFGEGVHRPRCSAPSQPSSCPLRSARRPRRVQKSADISCWLPVFSSPFVFIHVMCDLFVLAHNLLRLQEEVEVHAPKAALAGSLEGCLPRHPAQYLPDTRVLYGAQPSVWVLLNRHGGC